MKPDAMTINVYDSKIEEYQNLSIDAVQDKRLIQFANVLPNNATVLDYGCGPGAAAAYFADQGMTAHAFDASTEMVALADRHSRVKAWKAGFHEFSEVREYDGVWASFSLLHAPRKDMPSLLTRIHKSLKTAGKFCISVKLGDGEARDSLGRLYTYYQHNELETLLKDAGFTWTNHIKGSSKGLDGTFSDWISIFADA